MSEHSQQKFIERIFFVDEEYFNVLIEQIDGAQKSIDLEAYIFNYDRVGKRVAAALIRARLRGVIVRVLIDGIGSSESASRLMHLFERHQIEFRIFHPLPWKFSQFNRFKYHVPFFLLKIIYSFLKINVRNHRKTCIIDNKILFTGSLNLTQEHLTRFSTKTGWRDTGIMLKNAKLAEMVNAFDATWNNRPHLEKTSVFFRRIHHNYILRLNNTWKKRRILKRDLHNRLQQAQKRIWITNAYFIPDSSLLRALIRAAFNQVDVRILLPKKSDLAFMPWASQAFYERLIRAGVKIYEYLPSILHAKTLIIDNWMLVGSSNLNHRSLLHDYELDLVVQEVANRKKLSAQFRTDIANAQLIELADLQKQPILRRMMGNFLLFLQFFI